MSRPYTAVEISRDGVRTVFHRQGKRAWVHSLEDRVMRDLGDILPCPRCPQIPLEGSESDSKPLNRVA